MGSWQSYTFSCCGCVPAPPPVAPVPVPAPVAVAAAPVAAPPVAAAPIAPAAAASGTNSECAAHKGCSDLKLTGTCCPAADGTYLGCCDVAALEEKVIVAQLTTQTKMLPAWCANLPETERAKAEAWWQAVFCSVGLNLRRAFWILSPLWFKNLTCLQPFESACLSNSTLIQAPCFKFLHCAA